MKKGVSPVIATILLIVIVLIIAIIIFIWARGFIKESVQKNERPAKDVCKDLNIVAAIEGEDIVIANEGNIPVHSLKIKEIKSDGSSNVIEVDDVGGDLGSGGSYRYFWEGSAEKIIIIPKILGTNEDGYKRIYVCDEGDGYTIYS